MKFTCTKENLNKGLNVVSHLAGKNISLPILNNILISADDNFIELSATNLEIGIKTKIRGKIEKKGKITLPARILSSFINFLPEEKVEFEVLENNEVQISSGTWKSKIKTQPADEYPLIPEIDKKNSFKILANNLRKILNTTIFAAVSNESRPELSGEYFELKNKNLSIVATDSYRLAKSTSEIVDEIKKETSFIVPIKTLQELVRILNDVENLDVEIFYEENQVLFILGGVELTSRLIDGEYPDYKQIIPETFQTKVKFNKSEMVNAIKAAGLFSKTGIFDVSLEFEKDKIVISSSNTQLGENKSEVRAEVDGDSTSIIFNYHYLLEGLVNNSNSNLILELTSPNNPAVLKTENDNENLYLIMSIRQ